MSKPNPDYFGAFSTLALSRTPSGVLTLRFHKDGGPAAFSGPMQAEMPRARSPRSPTTAPTAC